MRAVVITGYGGNEVVEVRNLPEPRPGPKDVLIRVRAASVNPVDWKIRSGQLRLVTGFRFPKVIGVECAGEVIEVGAGTRRLTRGDRVVVYAGPRRLGAYAGCVRVPAIQAFHAPRNLSFAEASTLPVAGITALQALNDLGRLRSGAAVLVNGASGGVGTFAVQIARLLGAEVTAVCSGPNSEMVRELGAFRVLDYTRKDFTLEPGRYDLILDAVAKSTFAGSRSALAPGGIYVSTLPSFSTLLGSFAPGSPGRRRARLVMVHPNAADMEWMRERIEAGDIRVVIDRGYALEEVRDAFAFSETGKARGKIVLEMP